MAAILVVEDDQTSRELVQVTLETAGHRVLQAPDGATALEQVERETPDLVVLDVRLPDVDGWEVCRRIRARTNVPIVFLTALGAEQDVVRGFALGGDDYLDKPFSPSVLLARVQAVLRRARGGGTTVELPGLTIDLANAIVHRGEEAIRLTATELRLLAALAQRPGEVVSSRELVKAAQGYDVPEGEAYRIVKVHVRRIRQKIEPEPDRPRHLLSVRGLGYVLGAQGQDAEAR